MKIPPPNIEQDAEHIAASAFMFLSSDTDRFGCFLTHSGLNPASIRTMISTPTFLIGILDYLMHDESLLMSFAQNENIPPQIIIQAYQALSNCEVT